MRIWCTAGIKEVSHVDPLFWHRDDSFDTIAVANILSLGWVISRFEVTFGRGTREEFVLHLPNGRTGSFQRIGRGLYASQRLVRGQLRKDVVPAIETVEENKRRLTKQEVRDAERTRPLQMTLMLPNNRHLKTISELLCVCHITLRDVDNSKGKFEPVLGGLRGGRYGPGRS